MKFRQYSKMRSFLPISFFLICFLALSIPGFSQSENINVLDNWVEWSNAENMLNLHINKQAFHYLDIREKEIDKLNTQSDWEKRQKEIKKVQDLMKLLTKFQSMKIPTT